MELLNTCHPLKSSVEVEKSVLQLRMPPAARLLAFSRELSERKVVADPTIGLGIGSLNLNLTSMAYSVRLPQFCRKAKTPQFHGTKARFPSICFWVLAHHGSLPTLRALLVPEKRIWEEGGRFNQERPY